MHVLTPPLPLPLPLLYRYTHFDDESNVLKQIDIDRCPAEQDDWNDDSDEEG